MAALTPNLLIQRLGLDAPAAVITPAMWNAVVDALDGPAVVLIPDASTYTFLAANSGKLHIAPNFTNTCTFSFPAALPGYKFPVLYGGAAADGQNWVFNTLSDLKYFVGSVLWLTHTTGDAVDPVYSDGNSNSKLTVVTPAGGSKVIFTGGPSGTWYVEGVVASATTPAFADQ